MAEAEGWVGRDLVKARAVALRAVTKADTLGSTLLLARAYGVLCQLDAGGGVSMEQTTRECSNSRAAYVSAGDLNNAARTLNDLAGAYFLQGNLARADSMWREAITEFRKVGDEEGLEAASNNLGSTLLTQGNLKEARKLLRLAVASSERIDDKDGVAQALTGLGDIALQSGDLQAAQNDYQRCAAVASSINDKSATAFGMAGMGDVLVEERELAGAYSFYNKALQMRTEVGDKQAVAETRIQVARISIDEGHAADAVGSLRSIQQESHESSNPDDELQAGLMLTRALLVNAKIDEARLEITALRTLAQTTQNRLLAIRYNYMLALVQGRAGDVHASGIGLAASLRQARTCGLTLLEQEISISAARLQAQSGPAATSKRLAALQSAANSKGLYLLAQYATATD